MAGTSIPSGHALAQQAYAAKLTLETEIRSLLLSIMGTEDDSIMYVEESPGSDRGTNKKIRFQGFEAAPLPKGTYTYGQESTPTWYEDNFNIDYLCFGDQAIELEVRDQNEVDFSLRDSCQIALARESAEIWEHSLFHQAAGYTPVNTSTYTIKGIPYAMSCLNAAVAPDTAHHFFCPDASGANANETAVAADSGSTMTSRVWDDVVRKIRSRSYVRWPIAPGRTPWGKGYLVLGNGQFLQQMKENSSDSDIYQLTLAEAQGGADPDTLATWTNNGFRYKDGIFLESDFACLGCSGETPGADTAGTAISNVQRAVVLGARAMHIRFGMGFTGGIHMGYFEETFGRRWSCATDSVFGAKATIVNGERWGSAVISHYSDLTTSSANLYL